MYKIVPETTNSSHYNVMTYMLHYCWSIRSSCSCAVLLPDIFKYTVRSACVLTGCVCSSVPYICRLWSAVWFSLRQVCHHVLWLLHWSAPEPNSFNVLKTALISKLYGTFVNVCSSAHIIVVTRFYMLETCVDMVMLYLIPLSHVCLI